MRKYQSSIIQEKRLNTHAQYAKLINTRKLWFGEDFSTANYHTMILSYYANMMSVVNYVEINI